MPPFNRIRGFFLGGDLHLESTMSLDDKNKQLNDAVNSRLSQLQAVIERHEQALKAMTIHRDTSCTYRTDELVDQENGLYACIYFRIGMVKYGGSWRLCHDVMEERSGPDDGPEWRPLVDSPVQVRIEAIAHIDKLRAAIVAEKESLLPELEMAIAVAVNALDDYPLQPTPRKTQKSSGPTRDKKLAVINAWLGNPQITIKKAPNVPNAYLLDNVNVAGLDVVPLVWCYTKKEDAETTDDMAKGYQCRNELRHDDGAMFVAYSKYDYSQGGKTMPVTLHDKKIEALHDWLGGENLIIDQPSENAPDVYSIDNATIQGFHAVPLVVVLTVEQDASEGVDVARVYEHRSEIAHRDGTRFVVYHNLPNR